MNWEEADMIKTILVPLDGSKRAETILPHVEDLARRYNANVVLLQIVEPLPVVIGFEGGYAPPSQQEVEHWAKEAESYLTGLQGEFRKKGIEARAHVGHGPVVETIINTAERQSADLIAMASHGRTGLSKVFYGSVAAGVLQRVDRPLLLIRSQGEE
jgi:nucleotide-binding universal stress UspA family protein